MRLCVCVVLCKHEGDGTTDGLQMEGQRARQLNSIGRIARSLSHTLSTRPVANVHVQLSRLPPACSALVPPLLWTFSAQVCSGPPHANTILPHFFLLFYAYTHAEKRLAHNIVRPSSH